MTSSPYHSQSNGKAESAVKIAKNIIKKVTKAKQDLHLAVLDWRNTPATNGSSPVQKLMSRRTRTLLPTPGVFLQPKVIGGVQENIKLQKQKAKRQYDKTAKPLPELQIGQPVRLQPTSHHTPWKTGTCVDTDGSRSYIIELDSGQVLRRNRKHLRPARQPETPTPEIHPAQPTLYPRHTHHQMNQPNRLSETNQVTQTMEQQFLRSRSRFL